MSYIEVIYYDSIIATKEEEDTEEEETTQDAEYSRKSDSPIWDAESAPPSEGSGLCR